MATFWATEYRGVAALRTIADAIGWSFEAPSDNKLVV